MKTPSKGSAIVVVIVFMGALLLVLGVLLPRAVTERRLTQRHALWLESRNAAEAAAEYGFAQIRDRFRTRTNITLDPMGEDRLQLPPAEFWSGGNVVVSGAAANRGLEVIAGMVTPVTSPGSAFYFVDPADLNNQFDPLKGKWVVRRDVMVIARATTAARGDKGGITSHCGQRISVRLSPLFAHAIFYNMDLELFPGPRMTISGPVHANGNLYLYPDSGGGLTFSGQVTASGDVYHDSMFRIEKDVLTNPNLRGSVLFRNAAGGFADLVDSDRVWRDSSLGSGAPWREGSVPWAGFRGNSSSTWAGNLQTAAHGIEPYAPVAFGTYSRQSEEAAKSGIDDSNNSARCLIEPPVTDTESPLYNAEVEAQKLSRKAGVYVRVDPLSGAVTINGKSTPLGSSLAVWSPYRENEDGSLAGGMWDQHRAKDTSNLPASYSSLARTEQGKVDLLVLDMDALRNAVATLAGSSTVARSTGSAPVNPIDVIPDLSTNQWTGVVYVEVLGAPTTRAVTDSSDPAARPQGQTLAVAGAAGAAAKRTAVMVVNGRGRLPSLGSANPRLTLATNAPLYILGDYNADGSVRKTNPNSATDPEKDEVPASILSDAITLLSDGFDIARSKLNTAPSKGKLQIPKPKDTDGVTRKGTSIEVAAAIATGITPSNKSANGLVSGGAHNLPRFLEAWSGYEVHLRGSLVSMWESRVADEPFYYTSTRADIDGGYRYDYYSPPDRNWGFNSLFARGVFPPGTPMMLSFRRTDFMDLGAAEYAAMKDSFGWKQGEQ